MEEVFQCVSCRHNSTEMFLDLKFRDHYYIVSLKAGVHKLKVPQLKSVHLLFILRIYYKNMLAC